MKHLCISAGMIIGILLSYLIHYRWHYFGANFVTFRTVMSVWIGFPVIGGCLAAIIEAVISEKK